MVVVGEVPSAELNGVRGRVVDFDPIVTTPGDLVGIGVIGICPIVVGEKLGDEKLADVVGSEGPGGGRPNLTTVVLSERPKVIGGERRQSGESVREIRILRAEIDEVIPISGSRSTVARAFF